MQTCDRPPMDAFSGLSEASRLRLAGCAKQSPQLRELAVAHPLAFTALTNSYGPRAGRKLALKRLMEGKRLASVCEALAIPNCLKAIPTSACPDRLPFVPWTPSFNKRLKNEIPDDPVDMARWLQVTFYGARAVDPHFGMWMARNHELFDAKRVHLRDMLPLALFAWYSNRKAGSLSLFTEGQWGPTSSLSSTLHHTNRWLRRLAMGLHFESLGYAAEGYEFIELRSVFCVEDEARAMDNCLARYGAALCMGTRRLFSVRRMGARAATLEIIRASDGRWRLGELKGVSNIDPSIEVFQATTIWLNRIQEYDTPFAERTSQADANLVLRKHLGPYAEAAEKHEKWLSDLTIVGLVHSAQRVAGAHGIDLSVFL